MALLPNLENRWSFWEQIESIMSNRTGVLVGDSEHAVQGPMLSVGQTAPDFLLQRRDLEMRTLADYSDKVKIISVVPSVDTRVCHIQTKRFSNEVGVLDERIVLLTVSADLPFALARFCVEEGIDNAEALSDHYSMQFAHDYGVLDTEWRICQRAVFVVDEENVIRHAEYVHVISDEPDYETALATVNSLL